MAQNNNNQPPTESDLMGWANTYGITHPIVTDPDFGEAVQYLWANPPSMAVSVSQYATSLFWNGCILKWMAF